jgi:hypothetical protein
VGGRPLCPVHKVAGGGGHGCRLSLRLLAAADSAFNFYINSCRQLYKLLDFPGRMLELGPAVVKEKKVVIQTPEPTIRIG